MRNDDQVVYQSRELKVGIPGETSYSEWPFAFEESDEAKCWLPHSCDEWLIGNVADAERLIADLQEFIKRARGGSDE